MLPDRGMGDDTVEADEGCADDDNRDAAESGAEPGGTRVLEKRAFMEAIRLESTPTA